MAIKLADIREGRFCEILLGNLVSIVCHRGGEGEPGHFVSYHRDDITDNWYLNDDHHPVARTARHPFVGLVPDETVDLLVYKKI